MLYYVPERPVWRMKMDEAKTAKRYAHDRRPVISKRYWAVKSMWHDTKIPNSDADKNLVCFLLKRLTSECYIKSKRYLAPPHILDFFPYSIPANPFRSSSFVFVLVSRHSISRKDPSFVISRSIRFLSGSRHVGESITFSSTFSVSQEKSNWIAPLFITACHLIENQRQRELHRDGAIFNKKARENVRKHRTKSQEERKLQKKNKKTKKTYGDSRTLS